jgi:tetratricopeptide (TPR) repeat protein
MVFRAPLYAESSAGENIQIAKKHFSFAVQQRNAGNLEEARRQFEKSVAACDTIYQIHYAFGDLLAAMDDKKAAIARFRRALDIEPSYYNAAARLAALYHETGDYASTLEMYELMYSMKPEEKKLLATIANIREYLGDGDGAYAGLVKLVEQGEDTYENLIRVAEMAMGREDYDNAHLYAVMALGKKKSDARALEIAGKSSVLRGDKESAVGFYRELAEADSVTVATLAIIEDLYRNLNDRSGLIWALKRHHAIEPGNVEVLGELCENYFPDGITEEGVEYIRKGLALAPEDGRFRILLGENYRSLGQTEKALAEYRKALADERWKSSAQRLIWQIDRPESEEEQKERAFFGRGNRWRNRGNSSDSDEENK